LPASGACLRGSSEALGAEHVRRAEDDCTGVYCQRIIRTHVSTTNGRTEYRTVACPRSHARVRVVRLLACVFVRVYAHVYVYVVSVYARTRMCVCSRKYTRLYTRSRILIAGTNTSGVGSWRQISDIDRRRVRQNEAERHMRMHAARARLVAIREARTRGGAPTQQLDTTFFP
jgi:hypothetical protein